MAHATALAFASHEWDIILAGRNLEDIKKVASDIALRTQRKHDAFAVYHFDALKPNLHKAFWDNLPCCPDAILCAVGGGGDPQLAQHDLELADSIVRVNFSGLLPIFLLAADAFEKRGSGSIIGISSVAGDRGRAANYIYGSAKAGFSKFLEGLRNRLASKGVHVMTVKPGPAYTSMSDGLDLPRYLTATPYEIGQQIFRGYMLKKDTIYIKKIWKWIMLVIIHIPEFIFKRTNLETKKVDQTTNI
jgi:short-subunit dehydrogenase